VLVVLPLVFAVAQRRAPVKSPSLYHADHQPEAAVAKD
jgi:hypothetical protein